MNESIVIIVFGHANLVQCRIWFNIIELNQYAVMHCLCCTISVKNMVAFWCIYASVTDPLRPLIQEDGLGLIPEPKYRQENMLAFFYKS